MIQFKRELYLDVQHTSKVKIKQLLTLFQRRPVTVPSALKRVPTEPEYFMKEDEGMILLSVKQR